VRYAFLVTGSAFLNILVSQYVNIDVSYRPRKTARITPAR
jgi:hypothetical protein